jgi:hypothetical protein
MYCKEMSNLLLKVIRFSCFLTAIFLYGCKEITPKLAVDRAAALKIDIRNSRSIEIKNFINEVKAPKIIAFKSKDASFFVASIKKIIVCRNEYFILDNRFSSLSRFDSSGNFIMSYGSIGLGKNEFRKINDFDIDSLHEQVVIFSNTNTAFFYYSLRTGTFIKKVNTGIFGSRFCIIPGKENLLYRNFSADDKGRNYNVMTLDSVGKQTGESFLFNARLSEFAWESTGFLNNSNGQILFANAFSDTVYQFSDHSFKPVFEINITSDTVKANQFDHGKLIAKNILLDSTASMLGSEFFVNHDFVVFNYQQNRTIKTSIYNLSTKMLYTLPGSNKTDPLFSFFLTPVFLDAENNLYFKFDMKNVLALKKKDPALFNKLLPEQKEILNMQDQHAGAFLLHTNINKNLIN